MTIDPDVFRDLVRCMREHQKDYFRTRSNEALRFSKAAERAVDQALAERPENGQQQGIPGVGA